jgi:anti-sigma28 factor (negative regulator of flagellin synthesis)
VLRLRPESEPSPAVSDDRSRPAHPRGRDLDSPLVERLRESVARGEYRVDAKRVARKLIAARVL